MRFNNRRLLLRFTIICLLLMATIGTAYWVQGHGFIEVDPSSDTDTSYTLLNQKTNASTTVFTKSGIFKKIVAKGTYEIIVGAGDSNYFGMATTKGFMQSTKVKSSLTQESVRRFVGNNPAECMGYTGSALVSYGCNSDYSHLTTHVPATAVTPTYASVDQKSGTRGSVEGIVQTTEGTIVLINVLKTPQNYAFHGVYRLDGGARGPAIPTLLSRPLDLIPDTSYTIKAYKTGFIVYDSNLEYVYYYASSTASPAQLKMTKPTQGGIVMNSLEPSNDSIAITYGNGPKSTAKRTLMTVQKNEEQLSYTFNEPYSKGYVCDSNKLCMLQNQRLDIYEYSGQTTKKLYSINNVKAVLPVNKQFFIATNSGILALNIDKQTGHFIYSYGVYSFASMNITPNGFVLKIKAPDQTSAALLFDGTHGDTSIDKLVEGLKAGPVKSISVYDKYIYIVPDVGGIVQNTNDNGFGFDPAKVAATATQINQLIDKSGIDKNKYTIVNTAL